WMRKPSRILSQGTPTGCALDPCAEGSSPPAGAQSLGRGVSSAKREAAGSVLGALVERHDLHVPGYLAGLVRGQALRQLGGPLPGRFVEVAAICRRHVEDPVVDGDRAGPDGKSCAKRSFEK